MISSGVKALNLREQTLDWPLMLRLLTRDKVLHKNDLERLQLLSSRCNSTLHPINYLDQQDCQLRLDGREDRSDPAINTNSVKTSGPARYFRLPQILTWLAELAGHAVVTIDPLLIERHAATQCMSYEYACQYHLLVLKQHADALVVVSSEPFISAWESELSHIHQKKIIRLLANPEAIDRYRAQFYQLAKVVAFAEQKNRRPVSSSVPLASATEWLNLNSATIDLKPVMIDPKQTLAAERNESEINQQHVVSIVDWLLRYAFDQRASDIHLEPRQPQSTIRFRIDGSLHTVYQLSHQVMAAVISRIKVVAGLDLAEKRKPQDGRLAIHHDNNKMVELRIATLPTVTGEKLVIRIFDPLLLRCSFSDLGLSVEDDQRWQTIIQQRSGIILLSGPTGSGKTTTLYKTLHSLTTPHVNICTIEDPIEMLVPAFNQMQVNQKIAVGFAAGVRALMRQDPDIIMIGEIRDPETAAMAIQAALTGHLVLSTIHTDDSCSVISRLLDLKVDAYLIRATLIAVMAQRLVKLLCPQCKKSELTSGDYFSVNQASAVGCKSCRDTGYSGRQGIYEILHCHEALKQFIEKPFDLARLKRQAVENGMRTLSDAGRKAVTLGLTTKEEITRVLVDTV